MDNIEKEVSVEKDPSNQLIIEEIAEAFVENNLQRNIAVRESSIAGTSKIFCTYLWTSYGGKILILISN